MYSYVKTKFEQAPAVSTPTILTLLGVFRDRQVVGATSLFFALARSSLAGRQFTDLKLVPNETVEVEGSSIQYVRGAHYR